MQNFSCRVQGHGKKVYQFLQKARKTPDDAGEENRISDDTDVSSPCLLSHAEHCLARHETHALHFHKRAARDLACALSEALHGPLGALRKPHEPDVIPWILCDDEGPNIEIHCPHRTLLFHLAALPRRERMRLGVLGRSVRSYGTHESAVQWRSL